MTSDQKPVTRLQSGSSISPPREIRLSKDRREITFRWGHGDLATIDGRALRENCNSAKTKRGKIDGRPSEPAQEDLLISNLQLVGHYGLNITFSDGHDRGIYPWSLLRDLAAKQAGEK